MIFGEDIKEFVCVNFHREDSPGIVRKFEMENPVSHIDSVNDQLIIAPDPQSDRYSVWWSNTQSYTLAEYITLMLTRDYNHSPDERCAVWRYMFFTRWPNTRCVRYERVHYNEVDRFKMIAVSQIKEFGI